MFASPNGAEVIDVVPIVEIVDVRSSEELKPSASRQAKETKDILLGDTISDTDSDTPAATPSKARMEVILQTQPGGYNSGRTYRVRAASARDAELLAEDVGRLAATGRAKLQKKSWLTRVQAASPPPILNRPPLHSTHTLSLAHMLALTHPHPH
jgi:hypothetical protein